jgi:hypothetical protein
MAACDVFDSILADPDLRLDMLLEPGDISLPTITPCCIRAPASRTMKTPPSAANCCACG